MNKRLLIVSCSATKSQAPGVMPALDRYQGAYYQMIHQVPVEERPEIVILSALHGFLAATHPIEDYNQAMTVARAWELLGDPGTRSQWRYLMGGTFYDEIFIAAGAHYRRVITPLLAMLPNTPKILTVSGGIGHHRQQLKAWLAEGRP